MHNDDLPMFSDLCAALPCYVVLETSQGRGTLPELGAHCMAEQWANQPQFYLPPPHILYSACPACTGGPQQGESTFTSDLNSN